MDLPDQPQLGSSRLDIQIDEFVEANWLQKEGNTWGFAIVRPSAVESTTEQWNTALSTIRNSISRYFNAERIFSRPPLEPLADDAILPMRKLDLVVLDLDMPPGHSGVADNVMIDAARERFRSWRVEQLKVIRQQDQQERRAAGVLDENAEEDDLDTYFLPGHRDVTLLVDSQAMEGLLHPRDADPKLAPYVLAVDSEYEPNSDEGHLGYEGYLGWTRVLTSELPDFFSIIQFGEMPRFCPPQRFPGQIPLYDGTGAGTLIDPPGGLVLSPEYPGTQRGTQRGVTRPNQ